MENPEITQEDGTTFKEVDLSGAEINPTAEPEKTNNSRRSIAPRNEGKVKMRKRLLKYRKRSQKRRLEC